MNKTEEEIKSDWEALNTFHVEQACNHLACYDGSIQEYIADTIASLCGVNKNEMFKATDIVYFAHARWLYWYSYRYLTNESYDKISIQSFHGEHKFAQRTIQNGVNKMAMMIEKEPIWKKRWAIVKRIIKLKDESTSMDFTDSTIVIQVPRGMKEKIKIEIKEK